MHSHTYTDTHIIAAWRHAYRPYMCHIWSLAISLCFGGQSSCRPAGLGFDHCVQEVRFVEFGPAHCPSCAQLLTQTIVSWDRVIWAWKCITRPVKHTLLQELAHKNTQIHKNLRAKTVKCVIMKEKWYSKFKVCSSVNIFHRLLYNSLLET